MIKIFNETHESIINIKNELTELNSSCSWDHKYLLGVLSSLSLSSEDVCRWLSSFENNPQGENIELLAVLKSHQLIPDLIDVIEKYCDLTLDARYSVDYNEISRSEWDAMMSGIKACNLRLASVRRG